MTLSSYTPNSYSGDGVTDTFNVTFIFWANTDLVVTKLTSAGVKSTYVLGTHYTVSGGNGSTGSITTLSGSIPASGDTLKIESAIPQTQTNSLPTGGELPSAIVEEMADRVVREIQQIQQSIDRVPKLSNMSTDSFGDLPDRVASTFLTLDASKNLQWSPQTTLPSWTATVPVRNKLINGNFDIWQRGTSFTGSNEYTADRFGTQNASTTYTITRQPFTVGQTDVPNNPNYYMRCVSSSVAGAGNFLLINQRIEDVGLSSGESMILSLYAKADAARNIAVEFSQTFGVGGSSEVASISVTTLALTTSWQKFKVPVTYPSISGKTVGADSYYRFLLWLDAGSNWNSRTNSLGQQSGTFEFAQLQLEDGTNATEFEQRPIGQELALCQRYYCKSYAIDTSPGTVTNVNAVGWRANGAAHAGTFEFPITMRATPTKTFYNPTTGGTGTWRDDVPADLTAAVVDQGESRTSVVLTTSSDGAFIRGHYTAEAEL